MKASPWTLTQPGRYMCFFFSSVGSSECFHGCVTQKNASSRRRLTVRKRSKFPAVGALLHSFQCLATTARGLVHFELTKPTNVDYFTPKLRRHVKLFCFPLSVGD